MSKLYSNGVRKRKENSMPFFKTTYKYDDRIKWLSDFIVWLKEWHTNDKTSNSRLTNDTFSSLMQSTEVTIEIIDYIFQKFNIDYVLTGIFNLYNFIFV